MNRKRAIFVADLFANDYEGGAELTTEALIESSPVEVVKIHARNLNMELIQRFKDEIWIFGNFSSLDFNLIPVIVANLRYTVLEYDYKFCKYRSIEKHKHETGNECDCHESDVGKMVSAFYYAADHVFWMSNSQRERFQQRFPFLNQKTSTVLSSVFGRGFFAKLDQIATSKNQPTRNGWIVLGSKSWIKGFEDAESWCKSNEKEHEVVWNIPYDQMIDKLSRAEGFVYLPRGGDTCPRMVIEAKLLGCDVVTNDNVQHASEEWYQASPGDVCAYLRGRPDVFWGKIGEIIQKKPTLSGYSTTYNCVNQDYPFVESITSLLDVCDEVVVVDGGSTDGTWDVLREMSEENPRLKIAQVERDWNHPRHSVFDGLQKAAARDLCTGDFCWQQDVDEIIHENDYQKIRDLIQNIPKGTNLIALPVTEFWGNKGKIRIDINPWKWRLSRNHPDITHGIPAHLRRVDENGETYSMPGSDGCDFITKSTGELVPFVNFHTQQTEQLRQLAQSNEDAREKYVAWFEQVIKSLPGVYHYSWFNLPRKIKTYKGYWSKHWQSLYNITQEDTPQNNMFFDKSWAEVSDEEIDHLASRLEQEMGGWIFHRKIDWKNPTPSVRMKSVFHPEVMEDWIKDGKQ